jgi:ABC-type cobalamin/Fe3+-siderophores transport system ATPase subunit
MAGASLQISDIRVIRSGKTILNIDNLSIAAGQFVNIIGTNGAGKTTLLKVLCGLLKPTQGFVAFNKTAVLSQTPWQRSNLRKQIGYIPQAAEYNPELPFTVREVVAMGRTSVKPLLISLNRADYDYVDQWLDKVGLGNQKNQTFRSLSGGERQKALIARAMVQNPKVLMLDEPTSNLDFHWKLKISHFVQELQSQMNLTILMISHEIASIPLSADRTILLDGGKIIADGNSEEVLTSDIIQDVYRCRMRVFEEKGKRYIVNQEIAG